MAEGLIMEKLNVFDELYNPLEPTTASIDDVHTKGLWHQTFACWLVNKSKNTVLLQLRGPRNRVGPNSFDASASGHLSAGEKPDDGFRELEEELGISISETDRVYLGVFRNIAIIDKYINHEFCHIYLGNSEYSFTDFKLQEGEVDAVFEVDIDEAIKLFLGEVDSIKISNPNSERDLKIADMCNHNERVNVSNYYLKVMLAAKGLVNGDRVLVV